MDFKMENRTPPLKPLLVGGGVVLLFILLVAAGPFVIVGAGERGVVLRFGAVQDRILGEGLHLIVPLVEQVVKIDVKILKSETSPAAASKDLQDITTKIVLNYRVKADQVNWVVQNIGREKIIEERIIDPSVQEVVKAVTAKFTAIDLITQRAMVKEEIKGQLSARLANYNLEVTDFSIVNFEFSQQFTQAIESKQTAEQLALKASRDLDRIRVEAQQKIASAQAEAESLRIQRQNITPDLIRLRQIEAQQAAIAKWDGHLPKVTGPTMPFIDLKSLE